MNWKSSLFDGVTDLRNYGFTEFRKRIMDKQIRLHVAKKGPWEKLVEFLTGHNYVPPSTSLWPREFA